MKSVCNLAFRSMFHHKKHFLMTLLCFVLSVAVIASVFAIADSVLIASERSGDTESAESTAKLCIAFKIVSCLMSAFTVYTAFSIDFEDRIKEIGFLISLGMSRSQRLFFTLFQGFLYAVFSVPPGILSGYFIGYVFYDTCVATLVRMNLIANADFTLKAGSVIVSGIVGIAVSLLAALIPFLRMRNMTVMETIKPNQQINISLKQTILSKIAEKLFGRIGLLAGQNYDNYKGRYRAVSLALSCGATAFFAVYSFFYYPHRYYQSMGWTEEPWAVALRPTAIYLGTFFVLVFLICSLGSMRQNMEKRKRDLAVYQSFGISRADLSLILGIEFSFFTIYAILFTAIGSFAANYVFCLFIRAVSIPELPIYYPVGILGMFVAFDVIIGFGLFLYSDYSAKKIDIIDAIRNP